jgi:dTDP-4-amino-4,6-dideoxygalactose transaminase
MNPHHITKLFESKLCEYTGAPYSVALDNGSNALFLALEYWRRKQPNCFEIGHKHKILIPSNTYPSVPCEIIHAGLQPQFYTSMSDLKGAYELRPTNIWDCALRFTSGMYIKGQTQCLSFTGPKKHLKLGKGGAILTDDEKAHEWYKRARFSGRHECSYHEDDFDDEPVIGWNFYMPVETAARGLHMLSDFPRHNEDIRLPYPDLSQFKIYNNK